tara:strand:+ start:6118 stop:7662 length:1545 start_codon:yes stop_codon:yes gene_type:complete
MVMNKYFKNKISDLKMTGVDARRIKKVSARLEEAGVSDDRSLKKYLLLKKASRKLGVNISAQEYKKMLNLNINSINDAYYSIVKNKAGTLKKTAYINMDPYPFDRLGQEFDVNKWIDIVHLIYDSVGQDEMTKESAIDYYSNYLDIEKEEDVNFKRWFKYYSDGEHLKYSSKEDGKMKKKAVYVGDLGQGNSQYSYGGSSSYLNKSTGFNLPGDSFEGTLLPDELLSKRRKRVSRDSGNDGSEEFSNWKGKLHAACRRIDKLLRNDKYLDKDDYKNLAELLMNLSLNVQGLKLSSTASDITHRAANTLSKHGHSQGADILKKVAQELPPQVGAPDVAPIPQPSMAPPPGAPVATPEPEGAAPQGDGVVAMKDLVDSASDAEPAPLKDIVPIPGARPDEYNDLAGEISLDDAAAKLDEVAGMLSDRRIIRLLAEFDIMLDKIGIASMFPELAESQSKLIDAFSYALTRVTKMMGQLSTAKSLIDARPSIVPGAPSDPPAQEVNPAQGLPEGEIVE